MNLVPSSFQKWLLCALAASAAAQTPRFTAREAIQAEWARQPPRFTDAEKAALPPADRTRLERAFARIGAPGAPALLPPELDRPTLEVWEGRAKAARTPRERVDALFFLNRLKSPRALLALEGLEPKDAATWPKHLHLEAQIATARLNGDEISPALRGFLHALRKAGKEDPVRAQAARLRLVMAGKEKELLPAVPATPGSTLAMVDAWNRHPKPPDFDWTQAFTELGRLKSCSYPTFLKGTHWASGPLSSTNAWRGAAALDHLLWLRLGESHPSSLDLSLAPYFESNWVMGAPALNRFWSLPTLAAFPKAWAVPKARTLLATFDDQSKGILLPILRKLDPSLADEVSSQLLKADHPIPRAAAIEDLPSPPSDLEALTRRCWADKDLDAQQMLIRSYARWKMPVEAQKRHLHPWLTHPDWACRHEAYQALVKLDPATPWPGAPKPTATDAAILRAATRLAERGRPVRLRLSFSGRRSVVLRLDPTVAPMNVANLVLLAQKGYFDGRLVPRVVPDFVVQMGSPYDTMDGGPGYTVRCENSLDWYGPGSVGMALSGKDTGGSQFFITTNATPHLTGRYTRLGELEDPERALKLLDDLELGARIVSLRVLDK